MLNDVDLVDPAQVKRYSDSQYMSFFSNNNNKNLGGGPKSSQLNSSQAKSNTIQGNGICGISQGKITVGTVQWNAMNQDLAPSVEESNEESSSIDRES